MTNKSINKQDEKEFQELIEVEEAIYAIYAMMKQENDEEKLSNLFHYLEIAKEVEEEKISSFHFDYEKGNRWYNYLNEFLLTNHGQNIEDVIIYENNLLYYRIYYLLGKLVNDFVPNANDNEEIVLKNYQKLQLKHSIWQDILMNYLFFLNQKMQEEEFIEIRYLLKRLEYKISFLFPSIENYLIIMNYSLPTNSLNISHELAAIYGINDSTYKSLTYELHLNDIGKKEINKILEITDDNMYLKFMGLKRMLLVMAMSKVVNREMQSMWLSSFKNGTEIGQNRIIKALKKANGTNELFCH